MPAPPFDENLFFDYLSYVVISCYRIAYRREAPSNNSLVVKLSKNVPRPPQNNVFLGGTWDTNWLIFIQKFLYGVDPTCEIFSLPHIN